MNETADPTRTLIERYLELWNERDGERRLRLIEKTFSENAVYRDPLMEGRGHEGLSAMVGAAQAQFPAYTFRLVSEVDGYADKVRFSWALGSEGVPDLVLGSDFGVIQAGRLLEVTGFLDKVPEVIEEG